MLKCLAKNLKIDQISIKQKLFFLKMIHIISLVHGTMRTDECNRYYQPDGPDADRVNGIDYHKHNSLELPFM